MSVTDSEAISEPGPRPLALVNIVEKFVLAGIDSHNSLLSRATMFQVSVKILRSLMRPELSLAAMHLWKKLASLRRLHHKANAMSAVELKLHVETCDETRLKRLTQHERAE